ncbi:hypothetical protein LCGC14_1121130 [marine sediment metagenome]|uniref:Uncharacterized protein n=1 Tax=marine sediment metagenome TaxID=412755 RepID=A0A0F9M3Z6_9ZZZZ
MTELSFTVWGQPIPASRVRITRRGNYYGDRYETWRALVQVAALRHGRPMLEGPVRLFIDIYGARKNADFDNLAKGIADSLEGIFYDNDRQIRYARIELHDCPAKERRAEITVSPYRNGEKGIVELGGE